MLLALFGLLALYATCLVIYRLWFHPLAKYPGPFLGRVSYLYEFYWDFWRKKLFHQVHENAFRRYGPIVRISYDKLRFQDPDAYFELCKPALCKGRIYNSFNAPNSMMCAISPATHRKVRARIANIFSRKNVLATEPLVQSKTEILRQRLLSICSSQLGCVASVNMHHAMYALLADVMQQFSFGMCEDTLLADNFTTPVTDALEQVTDSFNIVIWFNWVTNMSKSMPLWLTDIVSPKMAALARYEKKLMDYLNSMYERYRNGEKVTTQDGRATVFSELIDKVPDPKELFDEAFIVFSAGINTSSWTMCMLLFHLAQQPDVVKKLREELDRAFPDPNQTPDLLTLETLPFLTAVIKEGLRISVSTTGAQSRISPKGGITISGVHVPEGMTIEMDSSCVQRSAKVFHSPESFIPSRWLGADKSLDKYLVSFSCGPRNCIGKDIAMLNLYVVTTMFVRNFDIAISDELRKDGFQFNDVFVPRKAGAAPIYRLKPRWV